MAFVYICFSTFQFNDIMPAMMTKIEGYFAAPQMLLYSWAYRLIGKKYAYKRGQNYILPLEERTTKERAFILLFPLALLGILGLLLTAIWAVTFIGADFRADPLTYFRTAPWWHQSLWWLGILLIFYAALSLYYLPSAVKLLFDRRSQEQPDKSNKYQHERDRHQQSG